MTNELQQSLNALKEKYIDSLPEKISDIKSFWSNVFVNANPDDYEKLHRIAHSLAGSGATFGEEKISKAAKTLELALKELEDSLDNVGDTKKQLIDNLISDLETNINRAGSDALPDDIDKLAEAKAKVFDSKSHQIDKMKILVADDDTISRSQVCLFLKADGHEILEAENGRQAIEIFEEHNPELILMDVIMPEVTGYEAAEVIKHKSNKRFVPIIFLTAITDNESLAQCIMSGGDDFLNKPIHPLILNAKIKAMQRIRDMYQKLDAYQKTTEEEFETSKKVFNSLIQTQGEDIEGLNCWACSPGHFSGDTRLFKKLDNGHIYIFLCDFTGHGLPAALGTIFAADIFRSMSDKQMPAEKILLETNKKMIQIMPLGRYCAALLIDYDTSQQKIKIWNNGLPSGYALGHDGEIVYEIKSQGLPLGIVAETTVDDAHEIDATKLQSLIVFSDGVTEAENPAGEMYSEERLLQKIKSDNHSHDIFNVLKTDIESFMDGCEPVDDISLIVLNLKNQ